MFEAVQQRLQHAGLAHVVFGSAAGSVYGLRRLPADIDVLVRCDSLAPLWECFPDARPVAENGLALDEVELWQAPLILRAAGRSHVLPFDDQLAAHSLSHPRFGRVLGLEDQLLIKSILQRPAPEKSDVDDVRVMLAACGARIDRAYFAWRAEQCDALKRVRTLVPELLP